MDDLLMWHLVVRGLVVSTRDLFTKNVSAGTVKKLLDRLCGYNPDALHAHMTQLLRMHNDHDSDVLYALMCRMDVSVDDRYAVCMIEF